MNRHSVEFKILIRWGQAGIYWGEKVKLIDLYWNKVAGRRQHAFCKDNHSVHYLPLPSRHDVTSANESVNLLGIDVFQQGRLFAEVELPVDMLLSGEMISLP